MNIYENHTIVTKSWTHLMRRILIGALAIILLCIVELAFVPAGIIWALSLGHISFFKVFVLAGKNVFGDNTSEEDTKIDVLKKEGLATKQWIKSMTSAIFLFVTLVTAILSVLSYIIWLISLGHLHLYRITNKWLSFSSDKFIPEEE